jgi:hypothetical protein
MQNGCQLDEVKFNLYFQLVIIAFFSGAKSLTAEAG